MAMMTRWAAGFLAFMFVLGSVWLLGGCAPSAVVRGSGFENVKVEVGGPFREISALRTTPEGEFSFTFEECELSVRVLASRRGYLPQAWICQANPEREVQVVPRPWQADERRATRDQGPLLAPWRA
jgi:hypothetical protein